MVRVCIVNHSELVWILKKIIIFETTTDDRVSGGGPSLLLDRVCCWAKEGYRVLLGGPCHYCSTTRPCCWACVGLVHMYNTIHVARERVGCWRSQSNPLLTRIPTASTDIHTEPIYWQWNHSCEASNKPAIARASPQIEECSKYGNHSSESH